MPIIKPDASIMEKVIRTMPSMVFLINEKGIVYCVNKLFNKQLEYPDQDNPDIPIHEVNPYFTPQKWEEHWCNVAQEGECHYKAIFKKASGELFHVDVVDQFFSNNGKKVIYSIVQKEHFSIAYNSVTAHTEKVMKTGGWQMNFMDETLIVTNEIYALFPTATKKDLYPNSIHKYFKNGEAFKKLYQNIILKGTSINTILETKENPPRYLTLMADPIIQDDIIIKIIGVFRDVTSQIEKNKQLKLYKNIIDNTIDLIYIYDRKGNLVQYSNSVSEKLGFTIQELDRFTIFDLDTQMDETWWAKHFDELVRKKALQFEWMITRKNGTKFPADITANHLIHNGEDYNCAIVRDITDKKKSSLKLTEALKEIKQLKQQLELENEYLQEEAAKSINYDNILSESKNYRNVLNKLALVAPTESTVLITGESGTGKELIATAIHKNSRRGERPLIKVNCATLPKELIESELFGHKKGAFTGAIADKVGKFKLADNGTIFLDEIGEMPIELQAKLLRVLQEGEFEMLGNTKTTTVDVRIIAATNRKLENMIKKGTFREDLFYRLNVFPINNIPLRERKEDIPLLAQFFLEKYAAKIGKEFKKLSSKCIDKLMNYDFPGNVRELENMIERAVILEKGRVLKPGEWLPSTKEEVQKGDLLSFDSMQKKYIVQVLDYTNWRISGPKGAAKILDMNNKTLFAKMKKLGIEKKISVK